MIVNSIFGFNQGNALRLTYGLDCKGNVCGDKHADRDLHELDLTYWLNPNQVYRSGLKDSQFKLADARNICLLDCPIPSEDGLNWVCDYPEGHIRFSLDDWIDRNYDYFEFLTPEMRNISLQLQGPCYPVIYPSVNVYWRCQFIPCASNISLQHWHQMGGVNIDEDIVIDKSIHRSINTRSSVLKKYVADIGKCWAVLIVCGGLLPLFLSVIWLLMIRHFVAAMPRIRVALFNVLIISVTMFYYLKAGWIGNDAICPIIGERDPYMHVSGKELNHLRAAAVLMTAIMVVAVLTSIPIACCILMATSVLKVPLPLIIGLVVTYRGIEETIMAPDTKKQKLNKNDHNSNALMDRLGSLPDDILVHILSFLPTKLVVGTRVLSKRWETVWASVPNLDFNQRLSFHPRRWDDSVKFIEFVDQVLHAYTSSRIKRFSLFAYDVDPSYVSEWISFVVKRHVEELEIDVSSCKTPFEFMLIPTHVTFNIMEFPFSLFTCRTLVVLKMESGLELHASSSIHLPNLKILHVSLFHPEGDIVQKLVSGCPVLEELLLKVQNCLEEEISICIPAPALKWLSIYVNPNSCLHHDRKIVIIAPKLEYFTLEDEFFPDCLLLGNSCLIRATINVGMTDADAWFIPYGDHIDRLCNLLLAVSGAKFLSLSSTTMTALNFVDGNSNNLPMFEKLTNLELEVVHCCHLRMLPCILNCSPDLQYLSLKRDHAYVRDNFTGAFELTLPEWLPGCLLFQLKSVEFLHLLGNKEELKMIEYILMNAEVLQQMKFSFHGLESKIKEKFLAHASMFPRASNACKISQVPDGI